MKFKLKTQKFEDLKPGTFIMDSEGDVCMVVKEYDSQKEEYKLGMLHKGCVYALDYVVSVLSPSDVVFVDGRFELKSSRQGFETLPTNTFFLTGEGELCLTVIEDGQKKFWCDGHIFDEYDGYVLRVVEPSEVEIV